MGEQELINAIHALVGAGAGSTLVITIGKFVIQKLLKNFEDLNKKTSDLNSKTHDVLVQLSAINVKVESIDHHHHLITKMLELLNDHDRQLASLRERIGASRGQVFNHPANKDRM